MHEYAIRSLATSLLFVTVVNLTNAQKTVDGNFATVFPVHRRYAPVLDSSINVATLSRSARDQLILKIHDVDQLYRAPLHQPGLVAGSAEQKRYITLMMLNDPVNQALLFKILQLDGWPCDRGKSENSLSYKAWIVVWHNRGSYEGMSRFYPYLERANAENCIDKTLFKEVSDVLNQARTFRRGFAKTH